MTNQTQDTSKATPRPWKSAKAGSNMRNGYSQSEAILQDDGTVFQLVAGCFMDVRGGETQAEANASLIVRAVNERDALCAVAEAAKTISELRCYRNDLSNEFIEEIAKFRQTLANLAAVRKGGAK